MGLKTTWMCVGVLAASLASTAQAQQTQEEIEGFAYCGGEGGACDLSEVDESHRLTAYGLPSKALYYLESEGVPSLPCSHTVLGDPAIGTHKVCYRSPIVSSDAAKWTKCADEGPGQTCKAGLPDPYSVRRVRYGVPGHWVYFYAASDFQCTHNQMGINVDPKPFVRKICEVSSTVRKFPRAQWVDKGSENAKFRLPSAGVYMVRYGVKGKWLVRQVSAGTSNQVTCSVGAFAHDPAPGIHKKCELLTVQGVGDNTQIRSVKGQWEMVTQCSGAACTLSQELSTGVTEGQAHTAGSEWSISLGIAITHEGGVEAGGVSAKVAATASMEATHARKEEITRSFETTNGQAVSASCQAVRMYQWSVSVTEDCSKGTCITKARTPIYHCQEKSSDPLPKSPYDA